MSEGHDLKGKIALVTGASRGIGHAIATALAQQGMHVIGTATTAPGAERISAALSDFPGCRGEVLNVTEPGSCEAIVSQIVKADGGLHVLVNNAGINRDMLAVRLKDEDWATVIDTDLNAVFRLCRAAIRPMMKQQFGRIINITSVVGALGNPGQANYCAAKAGVAGMTRALAHELSGRGITVNAIAPGFIDTDMAEALPEERRKVLLAKIPMQRLGQGSDIAHAVNFLASPQAGYITGVELPVNGGMFMR